MLMLMLAPLRIHKHLIYLVLSELIVVLDVARWDAKPESVLQLNIIFFVHVDILDLLSFGH